MRPGLVGHPILFDILYPTPSRDNDSLVPGDDIEVWALKTSNSAATGRVTRSRERDWSATSVTEQRVRSSSQRTSSRNGVEEAPTGGSSPAASIQERGRSRRNSGQLPPVVPTASAASGTPADIAPETGAGPDETADDAPTNTPTSGAAENHNTGPPPPGGGPPDGDDGGDEPLTTTAQPPYLRDNAHDAACGCHGL